MNNTIQHMTEFNISEAYIFGREPEEVYYEEKSDVLEDVCPKSLLPKTKWEWNLEGGRHQGNANNSTLPRVFLMRLPREMGSSYLNRTRKSLKVHGYKNNCCEVDSVDGTELLLIEDEQNHNHSELTGINFNRESLTPGAIGVFLSHISVWRHGLIHRTPVVSLESDTVALTNWSISHEEFKDYDILHVMNHENIPRKCGSAREITIREGMEYWYGTGALLFPVTNKDPSEVMRTLSKELVDNNLQEGISLPVDHWINTMWRDKKFRIGSLCPASFEVIQDHVSTVNP